MKEIKFRGKRIDNNEWIYGNLIVDVNKTGRFFIIESGVISYKSNDTSIKEFINDYIEIIPNTIGQFTGLYDKNNTPIYEGDLIKYACGGTEDYVIQEIDEVFFNNEYGTFEIAINKNKENSEVLGFWLADLYEDSFYQVIGNIYDK